MESKRSLADSLYYNGTREYTAKSGNVMYLDGTPLRRPFSLQGAGRIFVLALVVVAIVIGAVFINRTVLASARAQENEKQAVETNLARPSGIQTMPLMAMVINLDDNGIKDLFAQYGYQMYDMTSMSSNGELTMYKLPDDVSAEEAGGLLMGGIDSLSAGDASRILQGSWYFQADRGSGTTMVSRYADFESGDLQVAVQNALAKQGFDETSITDSGVDDSGNTYTMGNIEVDGVACTWKISAIELDEIYDIPGLPEDAIYVGVRITK